MAIQSSRHVGPVPHVWHRFATALFVDELELQRGRWVPGSDGRFGRQLHIHILPNGTFDPWFGIGGGAEWLNGAAGIHASGPEYINLQLGLDGKATPDLGIGPFVMVTVGEYQGMSASILNQGTPSGAAVTPSVHGWLILGVRMAWDIH